MWPVQIPTYYMYLTIKILRDCEFCSILMWRFFGIRVGAIHWKVNMKLCCFLVASRNLFGLIHWSIIYLNITKNFLISHVFTELLLKWLSKLVSWLFNSNSHSCCSCSLYFGCRKCCSQFSNEKPEFHSSPLRNTSIRAT